MINSIIKKIATECSNIEEVRDHIDAIDYEILKAISLRQDYVKEIVKFKNPDRNSIIAKDRYDAVIAKRREWSSELNLNADVIESVYRKLMDHFIEEELKLVENK